MGLGELRMTIAELYSLTPRSFFNALNGARKKEDAMSKEQWLMTRKIIFWSARPYLENNEMEYDILPFEWEKKLLEKIKADKLADVANDLIRMNDFWERQDAAKTNTTE